MWSYLTVLRGWTEIYFYLLSFFDNARESHLIVLLLTPWFSLCFSHCRINVLYCPWVMRERERERQLDILIWFCFCLLVIYGIALSHEYSSYFNLLIFYLIFSLETSYHTKSKFLICILLFYALVTWLATVYL